MRKNTHHPTAARDRKRARFEQQSEPAPKSWRSPFLVGAVGVVAVVGVLYFGRSPGGDSSAGTAPTSTAVSARSTGAAAATSAGTVAPDGDVLRLQGASISGKASFYKVDAGGTVVPFFAVRDTSGSAVVALDACSVCAHAKKGYEQRGSAMLCRNCGLTFPIDGLAKMGGQGGCHPITVPARVEGDSVVIDKKELVAGAKWFS